jgi:hypothetical protein
MQPSKERTTSLLGLKENVIIGKLIPAGTGMKRYRNIKVDYGVNTELMENYKLNNDYEDEFEGGASKVVWQNPTLKYVFRMKALKSSETITKAKFNECTAGGPWFSRQILIDSITNFVIN